MLNHKLSSLCIQMRITRIRKKLIGKKYILLMEFEILSYYSPSILDDLTTQTNDVCKYIECKRIKKQYEI
jgi:hypothetical protein